MEDRNLHMAYGIGGYVKKRKERLRLHVYSQNQRAMRFYEREGFLPNMKSFDKETGVWEVEMIWKKTIGE